MSQTMTIEEAIERVVTCEALEARVLLSAVNLTDYLMYKAGRKWTYNVTSSQGSAVVVCNIKSASRLNGMGTVEHEYRADGQWRESTWFTLKSTGLYLHKSSWAEDDGSTGVEIEDAAVRLAPDRVVLGQTYTSYGTYAGRNSRRGERWTGQERIRITPLKFTSLTVSGTTYRALRVKISTVWSDTGGDSGTTTENQWIVKGKGAVKITRTEVKQTRRGTTKDTYKLTLK